MATKTKVTAYAFFLKHAGYSYGPGETPLQGRRRCAKTLAAAEQRASDAGVSFEWDIDPETTSADFTDEYPAWNLWTCLARDANGEVFSSLCGIDFGRDGEPWGNPYRRVIEAELACELPEQDSE